MSKGLASANGVSSSLLVLLMLPTLYELSLLLELLCDEGRALGLDCILALVFLLFIDRLRILGCWVPGRGGESGPSGLNVFRNGDGRGGTNDGLRRLFGSGISWFIL